MIKVSQTERCRSNNKIKGEEFDENKLSKDF